MISFTNVIKTCQWCNSNILAASGNEAFIAIIDQRIPHKSQMDLDVIHTKAINAIRWQNEYVLLSSSFDQQIAIYDIRKKQGNHIQSIHTMSLHKKFRSLTSPIWISNNQYISSHNKSLFIHQIDQNIDQIKQSQFIGFDASCLLYHNNSLITSAAKNIWILPNKY